MNEVEHTDYKSVGQLPIIILLIILFAFKYFGSSEEKSPEQDKVEYSKEINGVANSSTQDLFIQTSVPVN